ncbi:MAG TPA: hypothetical protein VGM37_01370 [Armatimonadota bacterium]|jgi:hypothetical protein
MTKTEYEEAKAAIKAGEGVTIRGRSAICVEDLDFIADAEGGIKGAKAGKETGKNAQPADKPAEGQESASKQPEGEAQ